MNYFDILLSGKITAYEEEPFKPEDVGKVVTESGGEYSLTAQTARSITENGTYDTTLNNEVTVNVSGGGGGDALVAFAKREVGTYDLTGVLSIPKYFANECRGSTILIPTATVIGQNAFQVTGAGQTIYISANWEQITEIGNYALGNATIIGGVVNAPNCYAGNSAFNGVTVNEITVKFCGKAFENCTATKITITDPTSDATNGQTYRYSAVRDIYLTNATSVLSMGYTSYWSTQTEAKPSGSGITFHVPSAMLSAYIADSGWQAFLAGNANNAIVAI